jgi:hypothetical protein
VERRLGSTAIDASLDVHVFVVGSPPTAANFSLHRGGEVIAERRFEPPPRDCEDLRRAVGLAIALAIEASATEPSPPPPAPVNAPAPAPEPPPRSSPGVGMPRSSPRVGVPDRPALSLTAEAFASYDLVPGLAFGAAAALEIGRWRMGALGTLPASVDVGTGSARVSLLAALAQACLTTSLSALGLRACPGLAAGVVLASGRGFFASSSVTVAWVAPIVRGDATLPLTRSLALVLGGSLVVPVLRPRLDVRFGPSEPFPPVGGNIGLGLAFRLR